MTSKTSNTSWKALIEVLEWEKLGSKGRRRIKDTAQHAITNVAEATAKLLQVQGSKLYVVLIARGGRAWAEPEETKKRRRRVGAWGMGARIRETQDSRVQVRRDKTPSADQTFRNGDNYHFGYFCDVNVLNYQQLPNKPVVSVYVLLGTSKYFALCCCCFFGTFWYFVTCQSNS